MNVIARPPALGPALRSIAPHVESRIHLWMQQVLNLTPHSGVELSEWVSLDSRAVPHVLHIVVTDAGTCLRLEVENASERLTEAELRAAVLRAQRSGPALERGAALLGSASFCAEGRASRLHPKDAARST